jgi:glutamine synthetase
MIAILATSQRRLNSTSVPPAVADTAYFGAEAEFFIFDNIRFDQREQHGFYFIDAEEGRWNSGREQNNLGYRPRYKEGYFPVPPMDHYQDLRTEMVMTMINCGLDVECHHHEVATGGQTEIDLKFDSLVKSADHMLLYKVRGQERCQSVRQDGDLHAEADFPGQR